MFEMSSLCAQSLHVINMLRRHGMNDQALQAVYSFSRNCSTRPVPGGASRITTTDDRHRIEAVVGRGVRAGTLYPADGPTAVQLVEDYDDTLFLIMKCRVAA